MVYGFSRAPSSQNTAQPAKGQLEKQLFETNRGFQRIYVGRGLRTNAGRLVNNWLDRARINS